MSVEELVKELNEIDDHLTTMAADKLEELAAENERLKDALSNIANAYTAHGYSNAMNAVQSLKDTAKEALNA